MMMMMMMMMMIMILWYAHTKTQDTHIHKHTQTYTNIHKPTTRRRVGSRGFLKALKPNGAYTTASILAIDVHLTWPDTIVCVTSTDTCPPLEELLISSIKGKFVNVTIMFLLLVDPMQTTHLVCCATKQGRQIQNVTVQTGGFIERPRLVVAQNNSAVINLTTALDDIVTWYQYS